MKKKRNKKLDRSIKSSISWILRYREFSYLLVKNGDNQVWRNLVELYDGIEDKPPFPIITDSLKWALNKYDNEKEINESRI